MRYIELLGLPGAGKTSIENYMQKHYGWVSLRVLRARYARSLRIHQRLMHATAEQAGLAGAFWPKISSLAAVDRDLMIQAVDLLEESQVNRDDAGRLLFKTLAQIGAFRQHAGAHETCIHAEGMQQRRFSFALRGVDVQDYTFLGSNKGHIVLIDVCSELAEKRRCERGKSRDRVKDWSLAPKALELVLESLPVPVYTIDGSEPINECCERLYSLFSSNTDN